MCSVKHFQSPLPTHDGADVEVPGLASHPVTPERVEVDRNAAHVPKRHQQRHLFFLKAEAFAGPQVLHQVPDRRRGFQECRRDDCPDVPWKWVVDVASSSLSRPVLQTILSSPHVAGRHVLQRRHPHQAGPVARTPALSEIVREPQHAEGLSLHTKGVV